MLFWIKATDSRGFKLDSADINYDFFTRYDNDDDHDGTDGYLIEKEDLPRALKALQLKIVKAETYNGSRDGPITYLGTARGTKAESEESSKTYFLDELAALFVAMVDLTGEAPPRVIVNWGSYTDGDPAPFRDVLSEFIRRTGGKHLELIGTESGVSAREDLYRRTNERIRIILWGSVGGSKTQYSKRNIFGVQLSNYDNDLRCFSYAMRGLPVKDQNDAVVGEVHNGTIYCHYPLHARSIGVDAKKRVFREFMKVALPLALLTEDELNQQLRILYEQERKTTRTAYLALCRGRHETQVRNAEGIVKNGSEKIVRLEREIVTAIREVADARELLSNKQAREASLNERLDREYTEILAIEKVRRVRIQGDQLTVTTGPLFCRDPRTRYLHRIGEFQIDISVSGGIRFLNLSPQSERPGGGNAPHVDSAGVPCFGNIRESVPQLIATYEFASVIMLAITFIESVNVNDSGGRTIQHYPRVIEEAAAHVGARKQTSQKGEAQHAT